MGVVSDAIDGIKDGIVDAIEEFMQKTLGGMIETVTTNAAGCMEDAILDAGSKVSETPSGWLSGAVSGRSPYEILQNVSNTAIMPVAIGIMSIIICYDLITACTDKNSFKDFDTSIFFRFIVKAWVAIYFMNNCFTIFSGIFDIGAAIVGKTTAIITSTDVSITEQLATAFSGSWYKDFSVGDLAGSLLLSLFTYVASLAIFVIITVVTAGRMIEIMIYFCSAPIPFATMTNKEWSHVGFSFLKTLLAFALQSFIIIVILVLFEVIFNAEVVSSLAGLETLSGALLKWLGYAVVCCFMLLKSGSIAKSICGTH
ncbi:MAG: CD0415/CD1112 family protein [Alistipes sp.]|nr:CD0415/CD1112 family protein [Alistipes sp.]